MKKIVLVFIAAIALGSLCFSGVIEKSVVIGYLKGSVRVIRKPDSASLPAKLGMNVFPGDKIETSKDSRLELKFEDGSNFRIAENTSVIMEELKQEDGIDKILCRIGFGRVWVNIKKTLESNPLLFRIASLKSSATVKGTTFRADVDFDGESEWGVYDGIVAVSKGGNEDKVNKYEKLTSKDFLKTKLDEAEDSKDDWVRWNKNRDKIRIMIVFTEKKNGELSFVPLSEVIFAEELLNNYMYTVIDQAALNQLRNDEKIKAALTDDKDEKKAAAAGLELGADIIITGQVDATAKQTVASYGMYTGIADMSIRVVKCDTAELILSKNGQRRMADPIDQGAFNNAVRKVSRFLVDGANNDIINSWKRETIKGSTLFVSLYNADFKKIQSIAQSLANIPGVRNVNQISLVDRRALLSLTFSGDSLSLAEQTAELKISDVKLEVVGVSLSRLEVEVK